VELLVKKFLKWTGFVVAGLAGLAALGIAYLYFASERELNRHHAVASPAAIAVPTDPAEIAEGRRLAHLTGCTHCHSENLSGAVPLDIPNVVRFVAPNLTELLPQYSDAQLVTLLRKGVRPDGTGVLFMPSEMTRHLSDQDLGRVIAFLRSAPPTPGVTGKTEVRFVGRYILASGQFKTAADTIEQAAPDVASANLSPAAARGRYLAMSACTECHGQDLNGRPEAKAPPLAIAKSYTADEFSKLMHEGIALGGRQYELMSPTALARFAVLTPEETAAIYEFLQSRG
jgi:cytochrome c553